MVDVAAVPSLRAELSHVARGILPYLVSLEVYYVPHLSHSFRPHHYNPSKTGTILLRTLLPVRAERFTKQETEIAIKWSKQDLHVMETVEENYPIEASRFPNILNTLDREHFTLPRCISFPGTATMRSPDAVGPVSRSAPLVRPECALRAAACAFHRRLHDLP